MAEGRPLLWDLTAHATQNPFVYSHRWRVGDVIIWNNRCTMHRGRPHDESHSRKSVTSRKLPPSPLRRKYHAFFTVVAGTMLGMMIANVPAVVLGDRIARRMPVRLVHTIAAGIFALLGLAALIGAGERFGF